MIAVLAFLRSPLGRYLMIGLAVVAGLAWVRHAGYSAGVKHERAASAAKLQVATGALQVCRENSGALTALITRMNEAASVLQAESDKRIAEASEGLSRAQRGRASAEARAAKLLAAPPAGIDACARMESADAAVLGSIK